MNDKYLLTHEFTVNFGYTVKRDYQILYSLENAKRVRDRLKKDKNYFNVKLYKLEEIQDAD